MEYADLFVIIIIITIFSGLILEEDLQNGLKHGQICWKELLMQYSFYLQLKAL